MSKVFTFSLCLYLRSLTKRLTGNDRFSRLAAYLSILSPSPSTLVTPTPESFFSFFALLGHLYACKATKGAAPSQDRLQIVDLWIASSCYAFATAFRANGLLLSGFLVWQVYWKPPRQISRLSAFLAPALAVHCTAPFFLSQGFAYIRFCYAESDRRQWCDKIIPSVYSHVQDQYWWVEVRMLPRIILNTHGPFLLFPPCQECGTFSILVFRPAPQLELGSTHPWPSFILGLFILPPQCSVDI
jgi:Gpi18-like mannosyltransferase